MNEPIETQGGMEFEQEQFASFGALRPIIEAFGREHGLRVSRIFDKDPITPSACYFLGWPRCFIRVSAADPLTVTQIFQISVCGPRRSFKKTWRYSVAEGGERLNAILTEAKSLSDLDALTPQEESSMDKSPHIS